MTQTELDRAVSRITGESRQTVRRHGFSLLTELPQEADDGSVDQDLQANFPDPAYTADEARLIALSECA